MHSSDLEDILIDAQYPLRSFNTAQNQVQERQFQFTAPFGKAFYKELCLGDVNIGYGDMSLSRNAAISIESNMEIVRMQFALNGDSIGHDKYSGQHFQFTSNQHNIVYCCGYDGDNQWMKNKNMQVFHVTLSRSFFEKYLFGHSAFDYFQRQLNTNSTAQLSQHNQRISPAMHLIIREILQTQRTDFHKRMFVEAKVIELLMLQFEQFIENQGQRAYSLNKIDVERMWEVKEIISNNVHDTSSLINLAKQVGTNEFTLKKGFKEIFGITVFGYWQQLKMNEAKRLLLDYKLTVSEVSAEIGYKNPRHFSTAFKKYFGQSPSQLTNGKFRGGIGVQGAG
ncbi:MAG: AraC family transcriptional regulator [Bacteroidota bacterium]